MAKIRPVPMRQQFAGLFGGDTVGDVRSMMEGERQARIRQAGVDARGGGFLPSLVARARQQGIESLRGGIRSGFDLAGAGDMITEDPRLAKARKRETDKNEIIAELNKFVADDGMISEEEMKQGYALLMQRGYPEEARKFLDDAKLMAEADYIKGGKGKSAEGKLGKTKLIQDKNGEKFFTRMMTVGNKSKAVYANINPKGPAEPEGKGAELQVIDDNVGQTGDIKLQRALEKLQLGSDLRKSEEKLKTKLAVEEALNKKKNEDRLDTRNKYIGAGVVARRGRRNVEIALALAKKVRTGGLPSAILAFKNAFGTAPADEEDLNSRTGGLVLAVLKELLGARPTDADLKFLVNKMAGMTKSKKANVRLLQNALDKIDQTIRIGDWWSASENAGKNLTDFSIQLQQTGVGSMTQDDPLNIR